MQDVDVLVLGAGWTSDFLLPLLDQHHLTWAATTTTGRDADNKSTIKWKFDPTADDQSYFSILPNARNIFITFPLVGKGQSELLVSSYRSTHRHSSHFLQLGSTGIWQISDQELWVNRHSKYDKENKRAIAEDELMFIGGCVLNLAGLWGGERDAKHWIDRVATTKGQVSEKTSLHMVHGIDVARAVVAIFQNWDNSKTEGQRWMLTDGFVYDWWALFSAWANVKSAAATGNPSNFPTKQSTWVYELMWEKDVKALPRSMEALGRAYDSREFWHTFGLSPLRAGMMT